MPGRPGDVHIGLAFDERFAPHARVTIESLLSAGRTETDPVDYVFWIACHPDVSADSRARLRRQVGDRAQVHFVRTEVDVDALGLARTVMLDHVTSAMYLRLDLPNLVDTDRLIYLDSDVLCTAPLTEMWSTDLGSAVVGAVRDAYTRRLSDTGALPGLEASTMDPTALYFNSGVLLIDVDAWRRAEVTVACLEHIERYRSVLRFPDQDALNATLYGRWARLDKRFNHHMVWRLERRFGGRLTDATLVHTTGPSKAWDSERAGTDLHTFYRWMRQRSDARAGAA